MSVPADAAPAQLWLVRHARVVVPPGTCYGQLDLQADPHATDICAHALAAALPEGLTLHCSPLQRCELLALTVIALRPDLALKIDARLCELYFGDWEGQLWQDIDRREIDAWAQNLAHAAPGGGETLAHMLDRVARALHDAGLESHPSLGQATPDVVWITHAGVARCVQWLLGGGAHTGRLPDAAQWPVQAPAPGRWARYPLGTPENPGEAGQPSRNEEALD